MNYKSMNAMANSFSISKEVADSLSATTSLAGKEMYLKDIEQKWDIDLSALSNQGKAAKRFDFVIKTDNQIYGIETNFYGGGGSKLNETARSYKMLSQEADTIDGFTFVWFTDGIGWKSAKGNLRETFDVMDAIYCIDDMENGVMDEVFVD